MILTAQGTGSTLFSFQKHQPAGGCCDVSPFEKPGRGKGEGRKKRGLEIKAEKSRKLHILVLNIWEGSRGDGWLPRSYSAAVAQENGIFQNAGLRFHITMCTFKLCAA